MIFDAVHTQAQRGRQLICDSYLSGHAATIWVCYCYPILNNIAGHGGYRGCLFA